MRSPVLACVLVVAACPSSLRRGAAEVLLPPEQEAALGKQVDREVRARMRPLEDAAVAAYVRGIGARLVGLARAHVEPAIEPHFSVVDDDQANAFAVPGGGIYVHTGLFLAARSEAELAGVLAHELGHVTMRHVAQGMATRFGLELLAGIALGQDPPALAQLGAAIAKDGYLLAYSRADEAEADRVAMETILASRRWNPRGLISMMETFRAREGDPGFLAFLRSHPSPAERIESLTRQWQAAGSPGGEDGMAAFLEVRARLPRRDGPRTNLDLSR